MPGRYGERVPETTSPDRYGQDPGRLHDRKLVGSPTVAAYLAAGSRLIRRALERSYAVDRFPGCRILTTAGRSRLSKATGAAIVAETHATDPAFRPPIRPATSTRPLPEKPGPSYRYLDLAIRGFGPVRSGWASATGSTIAFGPSPT